jgi:hypothetical protein
MTTKTARQTKNNTTKNLREKVHVCLWRWAVAYSGEVGWWIVAVVPQGYCFRRGAYLPVHCKCTCVEQQFCRPGP